jgi:sugar phosphate isomerase/epimerase
MGAYAGNPVPFEKVVARLGELGYDGLELPAIPGYGALETWPDSASRKRLMAMIKAANLGISAFGAELSAAPFYSNDPDVRRQARRLFDDSLDLCVDCDIPLIRVDTLAEPPGPPGVSRADAWKRAVDALRADAESACRRGVVVAWEFEPGFMFNKPSEILGMVAEVNHPNFTVMFDFCHAQMVAANGARQPRPRETLAGGALELLQKLSGHVGSLHLIDSDNTLHDNLTSTHAPFGTGVLDMDVLMEAARAAGYAGPWWTIDLCFCPRAWEELERSLGFVRDLLARHGF